MARPKKSAARAVKEDRAARASKERAKRERAQQQEEVAAILRIHDEEVAAVKTAAAVTTFTPLLAGKGMAALHEQLDERGYDAEIRESGIGYATAAALGVGFAALRFLPGALGVGVAGVAGQLGAADTGILTYRRKYVPTEEE